MFFFKYLFCEFLLLLSLGCRIFVAQVLQLLFGLFQVLLTLMPEYYLLFHLTIIHICQSGNRDIVVDDQREVLLLLAYFPLA